mmetsp:Transcript_17329/g.32826  ORF Transcript_17329/g.32826 Transcript_17329/m.32826 type:complete len:123 (-) Transcript_17329:1243-1611(-)
MISNIHVSLHEVIEQKDLTNSHESSLFTSTGIPFYADHSSNHTPDKVYYSTLPYDRNCTFSFSKHESIVHSLVSDKRMMPCLVLLHSEHLRQLLQSIYHASPLPIIAKAHVLDLALSEEDIC